MKYYFLKTIGKGVVPEYIQVRDTSFCIISYFKLSNIERGFSELKIIDEIKKAKLITFISTLENGKVTPFEF